MNHELSVRAPIEEAIAMLEELDSHTRDLGVEIQAKVFFEIGMTKIFKPR